jgi:hypothetical protein
MDSRFLRSARARGIELAGAGAIPLTLVTPGAAGAHNSLAAHDDAYRAFGATSVDARHGVFGNDHGYPLTLNQPTPTRATAHSPSTRTAPSGTSRRLASAAQTRSLTRSVMRSALTPRMSHLWRPSAA